MHRKSNERIGPKNSGLFTIAKYPVYPDRKWTPQPFLPPPTQPRRPDEPGQPRTASQRLQGKTSSEELLWAVWKAVNTVRAGVKWQVARRLRRPLGGAARRLRRPLGGASLGEALRAARRGASVASCVLAVLECKELWGNELWLYCYVVLYSILVCTVYYTAEKAKFYTVCTYVSNSWELTIFMHVFTSMNEICQLDIIMVYLDATSRHLKPVTNYNLASTPYFPSLQ